MQISSTSRERLGDRLVVASISGGKDSTALALILMQHEISHVRVFADTGSEVPETYDYLDPQEADVPFAAHAGGAGRRPCR